MSSLLYIPEFKDEAVRQIIDRGYSVGEVSKRFGVSGHGLYRWVKAVRPEKREEQAAELVEANSRILRRRAQLWRNEEAHEILGQAGAYFERFQHTGH